METIQKELRKLQKHALSLARGFEALQAQLGRELSPTAAAAAKSFAPHRHGIQPDSRPAAAAATAAPSPPPAAADLDRFNESETVDRFNESETLDRFNESETLDMFEPVDVAAVSPNPAQPAATQKVKRKAEGQGAGDRPVKLPSRPAPPSSSTLDDDDTDDEMGGAAAADCAGEKKKSPALKKFKDASATDYTLVAKPKQGAERVADGTKVGVLDRQNLAEFTDAGGRHLFMHRTTDGHWRVLSNHNVPPVFNKEMYDRKGNVYKLNLRAAHTYGNRYTDKQGRMRAIYPDPFYTLKKGDIDPTKAASGFLGIFIKE